uniref:Uncharacterized protein n=1 Tax=Craspedostauros australis TaxID=1486917 RepID=A0A7R9ZKK2_9STRA
MGQGLPYTVRYLRVRRAARLGGTPFSSLRTTCSWTQLHFKRARYRRPFMNPLRHHHKDFMLQARMQMERHDQTGAWSCWKATSTLPCLSVSLDKHFILTDGNTMDLIMWSFWRTNASRDIRDCNGLHRFSGGASRVPISPIEASASIHCNTCMSVNRQWAHAQA